MSHTTEPWAYDGSDVVATIDQFPTVIADCINHASIVRHNAEANARRIVACVNALAHVSTEQLESGELLNMGLAIKDLTKQRDELLAALSAEHGGDNYEPECELCHLVDKVKGGA